MLNRGFSLFEMLLALALMALIMLSAMTFYPQLQFSMLQLDQKSRLQETMEQAVAGLIKDIKRAGFIAADPQSISLSAIEINGANNCIILRYDAESTGDWRYNPLDAKTSDIFVYRFNKNNLEYRTGVPNCQGSGWDKLFDQTEIKVVKFLITQQPYFIEFELTAGLKTNAAITYTIKQFVKYENYD